MGTGIYIKVRSDGQKFKKKSPVIQAMLDLPLTGKQIIIVEKNIKEVKSSTY